MRVVALYNHGVVGGEWFFINVARLRERIFVFKVGEFFEIFFGVAGSVEVIVYGFKERYEGIGVVVAAWLLGCGSLRGLLAGVQCGCLY
ncbi:hypothetical protein BKD80_05760 [Corynebacterium diphtheriae]|uniref:hypothetical protein n=1 Tax=Corynebacterium diphtheriae TaxID=1717 RepID=UPI000929236F|nr:hypothetical protein [Corynebacterium diphtheriae]OJH92111.1 hypothetical protein BKD80_05760 [Corynebacterium diphtheriae]